MNSITGLNQHSRGQSRSLGFPASMISPLGQRGLLLVKIALALAMVALVTLTAVAAEQYFYAGHPLTESDFISLLQ